MNHDCIGFAAKSDFEPVIQPFGDVSDGIAVLQRTSDCVPSFSDPRELAQEKDVRAILRLRRARESVFGSELFADPAWDILLELYANELGQQRISVSSLCVAAAVPPTTALRWIGSLEKMGFIERSADPTDGRRIFVELSGSGLNAMNRYFRTIPRGVGLI